MGTADLGPDRRERIVELVTERGTARVRDLADHLDVSPMTIRRDIAQLAEEGRLERIHGGARLRGGRVAAEPLPTEKGLLNPEAKRAIAEVAARQIEPGDVVGIGSGTTALAFAERLCELADLTIVTTSVPVAQVFWKRGTARVILTGGEATRSHTLVGPIAMGSLERLHLDITVLGTHGIDSEEGCTAPNMLEAQVNKLMLKMARRTMVLADSDKWGIVGLSTFAQFTDLDMLVTDAKLPVNARMIVEEAEVKVLLAKM